MVNKINLIIITPQGTIINSLVDIVTVKTITGYMGILCGHVPLISTIVPSKLLYKINNKEYKLNISGGILQVEQKIIKIISDEVYVIN